MGQAQTRMRTTPPVYGEQVTSDQIKSDINQTRHEMDRTIDQLSERLRPRQLIDEFFSMLQRSGPNAGESAKEIGRTMSRQIRENPVPLALIGAGVAWMMFNRGDGSRKRSEHISSDDYSSGLDLEYQPDEQLYYQTDMPTDQPYYHYETGAAERGQPSGAPRHRESRGQSQSAVERAQERARNAAEQTRSAAERAQARASQAGGAASQKATQARAAMQQAASSTAETLRQGASRTSSALSQAAQTTRQRASEIGETARDRAAQLGEEARHGLETGRRAFNNAREQHPLALAGGFLALGLLVGLSAPRTRRETEMIGPTAQRVKQKAQEAGRDLAHRGAEVASATASAVRQEAVELKEDVQHAASDTLNAAMDAANREGVSPYDLREKAGHVAEQTGDAMRKSAKEEGLTGGQLKERAGEVVEQAKSAAKGEAGKKSSQEQTESQRSGEAAQKSSQQPEKR